ncbi:unnamed protein product [Onchocerca flexuosa]|uniref:Neur_chan_LBD domain-containing protein n=1 Tax=Onchocerca flexuosa TaxID=387005 RepID=A0A183HBI3_9BILA|nr:unnamed protein product [Onchocerca flexuosa]
MCLCDEKTRLPLYKALLPFCILGTLILLAALQDDVQLISEIPVTCNQLGKLAVAMKGSRFPLFTSPLLICLLCTIVLIATSQHDAQDNSNEEDITSMEREFVNIKRLLENLTLAELSDAELLQQFLRQR